MTRHNTIFAFVTVVLASGMAFTTSVVPERAWVKVRTVPGGDFKCKPCDNASATCNTSDPLYACNLQITLNNGTVKSVTGRRSDLTGCVLATGNATFSKTCSITPQPLEVMNE